MHKPLIPTAKSVMIVTVLATVVWVSAGSLTPPVGPVAPTMKNLSDVEPRTAIRNQFDTLTPVQISFSGSFYLAEDILALPGQHGIEITASNVTLDLNGFTVSGNLEVGSLDGIQVTGSRTNIAIRNGVVRDFFGHGVDLGSAENSIIEQVRATNNGSRGITIGEYGVVDRCVSRNNGDMGIFAGGKATISRCVASGNLSHGISVSENSVVSNCVASANGHSGISASSASIENCSATENQTGISAFSSKVTDCAASNNTGTGINAAGGYLFGNDCRNNDGAGIMVTALDTRVESNNVTNNDIGLDVGLSSNLIIRNSASGNTTMNYDIAGGNTVGPIVNAAGIAASSNPHANYDF